jgi:Cytochrome P460
VILNEGEIVPRNGRPAPAPEKEPATHQGEQSFGVVYANAPARGPLGSLESQTFPVGSIIVREKLARADSEVPELLAVMMKRAPGFNPKAGDWEFLLVNGDASKVIERQKKGSCLDCHASQRERDFVYPLPAPR